ncbi:MAG: hypothetical protein ACOX9R_01535 [Armatimonadota bacterium]|jgi:hypothetical protein
MSDARNSERACLRRDVLALAFIAAVALGVTWQVTVGPRALLPTELYLRFQPWRAHAAEFPDAEPVRNPILDAVQQFYPWRLHASRVVRQGEVPLWNTQMLCGTPFVGNGQSAIFYPETWLHYVINPLKALGWATFAFYLIAGWGMYLLLRVLGVTPLAGAIGGVTFMLSGFFTGWLTFPSLRSVAAWLPLALVGVELTVQRRRACWLGLTMLAVGMQFLAGHLQISIYVLVALAGYALFRLLGTMRERGKARTASYGLLVIAATVGGIALAGCQLGPSLEMVRLNYRVGGASYADQVSNGLAAQQLLILLMPDVFGNPVDSNHWGTSFSGRADRSYIETAWYIGVAPLLLAVAAVGLRPGGQRWFWLGVFALAVGLAFGTPLNALFRAAIPGYTQLTGVGRAVVLACTAGAVLAGLGADTLMQMRNDDRARRVVSGAAVVILLGGLGGGLATWVYTGGLEAAAEAAGVRLDLGGYTLAQIARFGGLLVASWALIALGAGQRTRWAWYALALVVALDLGYFAVKFTPAGRTDYLSVAPELVARIHEVEGPQRMATVGPDFLNRVSPNSHMILDLQSAQGSDSLIYAPYHRLLSEAQSDRFGYEQVDPDSALVDFMAVRWLSATVPVTSDGWRLKALTETRLYENEEAVPRAFVPSEVRPMPDEDAVFDEIVEGGDPLVARVVGEAGRWTAGERPELTIADYRANSVLITGEMRAGSWVVLADVAYPGWRAFADGAETRVVPADLVRRAVHPDRDTREVRFVYLPASFRLGMFGTLLALAALGAVAGAALTWRRGG